MEEYRKKLKHEAAFCGVYCALLNLAISMIWFVLPEFPNPIGKHFVSGAIIAFVFIRIAIAARNVGLLKNEEELKKHYIIVTDERNLAVRAAASSTGAKLIIYGLEIGAIVASNFDMKVFITLLAAYFFVIITLALSSLFYQKTM